MSRTFFSIFGCSLLTILLCSQVRGQQYRIPLGMRGQKILERWDILYEGDETFHSAVRPFTGRDGFRMAVRLDSIGQGAASDVRYMLTDNNEWFVWDKEDPRASFERDERIRKSRNPLFGTFYRTPAHFFELYRKDFFLQVDPILQFDLSSSFSDSDDGPYFNNLRGLSLRGSLDGKLYFFSNILEEQSRFPNYIRYWISRFRAIPGAGFYKEHNSRIFDVADAHDYLRAQGHLGYQASRHFGIELGHGDHFLGDGIRSIFLSGFAGNYFYLKLNTRVWKLQYQNIFGELSPIGARDDVGDRLLPKKYFAAHYLHFNLNDRLSFGLFETVVFARENQFELQYLNPVILYRTVEQTLGSSDNVLIGLNGKWDIARSLSLYGQLALDEFKLDELFGGNGWWGNKFGLQGGVKWLNAGGIRDLDLQLEVNLVRPYTYAHRDSFANYSHYNQSLAHPLGANFRELIVRGRYRPHRRVQIDLSTYIMDYGEDPEGLNYGKNILLSNETRVGDTGIELGQGIDTKVFHADFQASYEIRHNFYLDLILVFRKRTSDDAALEQETGYAGLGLRANIARRRNVL